MRLRLRLLLMCQGMVVDLLVLEAVEEDVRIEFSVADRARIVRSKGHLL